MNQLEFFDLAGPESTTRLARVDADEMDFETIFCPINSGHRRGGKRLTDLAVILPSRTIDDFVWTWSSDCLLTDRVVEIFRGNSFSGFEVKAVKSRYARSSERPPSLWELIVTGWGGVAPLESGIKLIEQCPGCGHKVYSSWTNPTNLIDSMQWEGQDFFMVWPLPRHIFVTPRVVKSIRQNSLSGVTFKPTTELNFPAALIPQLSPGRLSYCMPEKRARELGEPLGIY